jgi:D-alanyl-D-alanine-carboxypeptidase/D-alanyl-D-alanine-endopeptidase
MAATMKNLGFLILISSCLVGPTLRAQTAAAPSVPAKAVAGEWAGSVAGQVPLVLHLRADASGALTATLDSPSQGANGLACANIKLTGTTLTFEVPIVQGSYSGTLSTDGKAISGTWTQGGTGSPLDFSQTKTGAQAAADEAAVKPSGVDGDWKGALSAGGNTLHIVFHFHSVPGGTIRCVMDSIDQNQSGIPCGDVKLDGKKVNLDAAAVHGTYDGKLRADGTHIDGTWSQGTPMELDLTKQ